MPSNGIRYDNSTKSSAMELLKGGLSFSEVGKRLNVPRRTVQEWHSTPPLSLQPDSSAAIRVKAFELLNAGVKTSEIAKQCGVHSTTILYWRKKGPGATYKAHGIYPKKTKAKAMGLLKKGVSQSVIANRLGIPRSAVSNWKFKLRASETAQTGDSETAQRKKRYSPETRATVVRLLREGATVAGVSEKTGMLPSTIGRWKKEAGLCMPDRSLKAEAIKALEDAQLSGRPVADVAVSLGISINILYQLSARIRAQKRSSKQKDKSPKAVAEARLDRRVNSELKRREKTGRSIADIASYLGTSTRKIYSLAAKLERQNIEPKKTARVRFSLESRDEILVYFEKNGFARTIAHFNVSAGTLSSWKKKAGITTRSRSYPAKGTDPLFKWISVEHPWLEGWPDLARQYLPEIPRNQKERITVINALISKVLVPRAEQGLPYLPEHIFSRTVHPSELVEPVIAGRSIAKDRARLTNLLHEFFQWVLLHLYSETDDYGRSIPSPAFVNPITRVTDPTGPTHSQSVFPALPYGYITELRDLLAEGPNFRDWKTAQSLLGPGVGNAGNVSHDWFEVTEAQIDKQDPDCVYRIRNASARGAKEHPLGVRSILEMWSPVRFVALLIKLILPSRTYQVRVLDSGEGDTFRYTTKGAHVLWEENAGGLAEGTTAKPVQRGVFRMEKTQGAPDDVLIYINTNKTADATRSGAEKGFTFPWYADPVISANPFYWLEKLRNWQEKYNPLQSKTRWRDIPHALLNNIKSEQQLSGYPDTCFLFRDPSALSRHFPLSDNTLFTAWHHLLEEFELRLAKQGRSNPDGSPIKFVYGSARERTTYFPLHSLRVSLITALALEGKLPFALLQKIAGHSRLIMTLYYFKISSGALADVLQSAFARMDASKSETISKFLIQTDHDRLVKEAICANHGSISPALSADTNLRNPAGWMPLHHGMCLMGGNSLPIIGKENVGGCFNGGREINQDTGKIRFVPVPGGQKNCIRCRWFVTHPHSLWAMVEHTNNLLYHFSEAEVICVRAEAELNSLRRERHAAEENGVVFHQATALVDSQRRFETAMQKWSNLAEDVDASIRFVDRCRDALLAEPQEAVAQILAAGTEDDLRCAIESVDSELLQLSGVCEGVEFFPDLDPGKAIVRRSQLLDAALCREGEPAMFMLLDERDQLLVGNEMIRQLACTADPLQPLIGRRRVISTIDNRQSLRELGIDFPTIHKAVQKGISGKTLALGAPN